MVISLCGCVGVRGVKEWFGVCEESFLGGEGDCQVVCDNVEIWCYVVCFCDFFYQVQVQSRCGVGFFEDVLVLFLGKMFFFLCGWNFCLWFFFGLLGIFLFLVEFFLGIGIIGCVFLFEFWCFFKRLFFFFLVFRGRGRGGLQVVFYIWSCWWLWVLMFFRFIRRIWNVMCLLILILGQNCFGICFWGFSFGCIW